MTINKKLKVDQSILYETLANVFDKIETTSKVIEKRTILSDFLYSVIVSDETLVLKAVYLCLNKVCPDFVGLEMAIGHSILTQILAKTTGRKLSDITNEYKETGDLGIIAEKSRVAQPTIFPPQRLTIENVFDGLTQLCYINGQASTQNKIKIINRLLVACVNLEARYLFRSLEGNLRIGVGQKTVIHSLAQAYVKAQNAVEKKINIEDSDAINLLGSVYNEIPSYDIVIPALFKYGIPGIKEKCKFSPGIPVNPMLASPYKSISGILSRFEGHSFTCEYKYDGERAQIHFLRDGKMKIFSRNLEDMTYKYPDILNRFPKCVTKNARSFVIDSEVVAWCDTEHKVLPFHKLSQRKKKNVTIENITIPVMIVAFDLLYLNGESLLQKSFAVRRKILHDQFQPIPNEFMFVKGSDPDSVDGINEIFDASVRESCEGLMIKLLTGDDSMYIPSPTGSSRTKNWLKLKKDYVTGLGDSFDLVVLGAWNGEGKRAGEYGSFLLGVYDVQSETYQTICCVGTGFERAFLDDQKKALEEIRCREKKVYYEVGNKIKSPHVWFEPKVVWEIKAAQVIYSPAYTCARDIMDDGSGNGLSLRFPRFIRVRDDKSPEDATCPRQIKDALV